MYCVLGVPVAAVTARAGIVGNSHGSLQPSPQTFSAQSFLAPIVQTLDSAIHRINHYPADSVIGFPNTYPLDSDLSGGKRYPTFEQLGPGLYHEL